MSSRKKIMITLIIILLLLTAGVYGYGVYYFTEHFLPGSMVNGFNCSYMTVSQSEELLTQKVGAYVLTIDTRNNGQESITAKQAGLSYDSDGSVDKLIRNQDRFTWFLAFNQHRNYEVSSSIKYDEQKTEAAISELKCMQQENMTEPSDAHIEEKDDKFVIVPEQEGTALKPEKTSQDIIDALVTGRTPVDLETDGCYKEPKVYQSDETLTKNCDLINKLTDVVITYDFDDCTETVDRDMIKNWLTTDENGLYTLDKKQIEAYISELAAKYDTVGTERTFNTYDGREISVGGGDYGWKIDQAGEIAALTELIQSGSVWQNGDSADREPVYSQSAASRTGSDWGNTYVQVDLAGQHVYMIKDGACVWDAPCVTGNVSKAYTTPDGIYSLTYKEKDRILRGKKLDNGKYEYESHVDYWMPFNGGIGLHDANWRSKFGGTIYQTNGSHGCINLPPKVAAQVYENAYKGIPIICCN